MIYATVPSPVTLNIGFKVTG